MKTILIPTDFSSKAFQCIPSVCAQLRGEELTIVFIHLFKLSDSISELLLLSRRSKEYEHIDDDFYQGCESVKMTHQQVKTIKIEFFYGSTLSRFNTFVEANNIDYILHPEDCSVSKLTKSSIDPSVLLDRCKVPLLRSQQGSHIARSVRVDSNGHEPILTEVSL